MTFEFQSSAPLRTGSSVTRVQPTPLRDRAKPEPALLRFDHAPCTASSTSRAGPNGGLSESCLIEPSWARPIRGSGCRDTSPKSTPSRRPRHAEPLAAGSILTQIVHVKMVGDADDIRIGDAASRPSFLAGPAQARVVRSSSNAFRQRMWQGQSAAHARPDTNT